MDVEVSPDIGVIDEARQFIFLGAFAERIRFRSYVLFITLWALVVYCPLCHWVWAKDGFLYNLGAKGAIDFAGGTVVHISAGVSALVAALYLGSRRGYPKTAMQPNNLVMTLIGADSSGWDGLGLMPAVPSQAALIRHGPVP